MTTYGISKELIDILSILYASSGSSILDNNQIVDSFSSTVGVRQGYLLSPVLFNIFLENIMQYILKYIIRWGFMKHLERLQRRHP